LIERLGRLQLATAHQVRAAQRHARRLAKDLALFDSVWVDALVQARTLTTFQAARINAGKSDSLRVGPFVLLAQLPSPSYGACYRAREIGTTQEVRLTVIDCPDDPDAMVARIRSVIEISAAISTPHVIPIERCGADGPRVWVVSPQVSSRTAGELLIRGGRLPPDVVCEIARQMAAALTVCEVRGIVHGDISAGQLVLDPLGGAQLIHPGLRAAVRASEDDQTSALVPAAYDYMAPELARGLAPTSVATDIYACGALWWHLLAGRPPLSGATAEDRCHAAQTTRIRSIYPIAPDTPRVLVDAIARCTEHAIENRPAHFAELLEMLGPPSDRGQALVTRHVERGASPPERLVRRVRTMRRSPNAPTWLTVAAGVLLALSIGIWPLYQSGLSDNGAAARQIAKSDVPNAQTRLSVAAPRLAPAGQRNAEPKSTAPPNSEAVPTAAALPKGVAPQSARGATKPRDVVRTVALQPVPPRVEPTSVSREFLISAARPLAWEQVRPRAGQVVRARTGERAQVVLPAGGGTLAIDNLRFADIDFVVPALTASAQAALVVTARHVSFERCSFQSVSPASLTVAALHWSVEASSETEGMAVPCELSMRECVMARVGVGICAEIAGQATLKLSDVLFLGSGSFVSIVPSSVARGAEASRWPCTTDLQLRHCTVRGAACVLDLSAPRGDSAAGAVHVDARECVFAPHEAGTIVHVTGGVTPADVLRSLTWQGEGSVVARKIPVVLWSAASGQRRTVGDGKLPIEGLVRTELGFAGEADEGPDASRLVRWQVPLRSGQPPGIGDVPLALPSLR
jgi:serine/threonine-protein kinase